LPETLKDSNIGQTVALLVAGRFLISGFIMRKARITKGELLAHMRISGIGDFVEVEESYLEITGAISFIRKKE
jgi:uncharacterized membrane protein YcaP (DUF421 family)